MDSLAHQLASLSPAQRSLVEHWLRQEQAAGRRLVFSHDPDQWADLEL